MMIFHTTVPAIPERLNNMHYHLRFLQHRILSCSSSIICRLDQ